MTYKSTAQPLCRCCGKPIGKHVRTVYFGQKHPGFSNRPEHPHDKAEVQALFNEKVVAVRYHRLDPDNPYKVEGFPDRDWVSWASLWDGETYKARFFCGDPCAIKFAYSFAHAGYTCKAFIDAEKERAA